MKLVAKGNTAEIYEYGDNLICKLFYPQYPTDYIKHEFCNATLAEKLGIRTPKAHRLIVEGQRQGIVYDKVVGEAILEKISVASGLEYDMWLDKFVGFHKQLLLYRIDDAMSYKDFLKLFAEDEATIAKIDALPDGNCFVHGDFHFENVMVDADNNLILIDMMNVCKGTELYDIARTYFLLGYDSDVQSKYLERMEHSLEELLPYLDVILAVRENEVKR